MFVSGSAFSSAKKGDRDEDLENTIGNLLIANYQVMRLEQRLQGKVSIVNEKHSSFTFKRSGEWYKVFVGIERQPKGKEEFEAEQQKDPNPNNDNVILPYSAPNVSGTYLSLSDDMIIQ